MEGELRIKKTTGQKLQLKCAGAQLLKSKPGPGIRMRGQAGSSVFSRSDFPRLARISFEVRDGAGEPAKGKTRKRQTPAGGEVEGRPRFVEVRRQ